MASSPSFMAVLAELDHTKALVQNALLECDELDGMILDNLPGKNDYFVRTMLLDQLFAVKNNLRKALS